MANRRLGYRMLLVLINLSVGYGCKKPYSPPAITAKNNFLVVEGVIDAGTDSTVINLSRTVNISGAIIKNPESKAKVEVQGDGNTTYPLLETNNGRFVSSPLNLDNTHKYRLMITTADGRAYASNYEGVKTTPPIDTFGYRITSKGLNFYVNTHDPGNNTHYYRWDYSETYIFISAINSLYKYTPKPFYYTQQSIRRLPGEQIHICYVTSNSSTAILNSSARLSQDVINDNPVIQINSDAEKIYYRYSIILRQYAMTRDAYEFWTLVKKNTEQVGTIFDAQPSEAKTNLYCLSNPSEPVIGYLSVCTVAKKRLFIDRRDLPAWPFAPPQCNASSLGWYKKEIVPAELPDSVFIPLDIIKSGWDPIKKDTFYSVPVGYYDCVDCRYHLHGVNNKPAFWK